MAEWWLDYSAKPLSAATIKRTRVGPDGETPTGTIRYIDAPDRLGWKHVTKGEFDDHRDAGLGQLLVMEVNVDDPVGGYARGRAYAQRALAGAEWLGYDGLIFFCADGWFSSTGVTPAQWRAYLDGAASVLGIARTGAYGFADAMDAAVGKAAMFWQAGSRRVVRDHVHIWQDNNTQPYVGGIQTDRNLILKPIGGGGAAPGGGNDVGQVEGFTDEALDTLRWAVADLVWNRRLTPEADAPSRVARRVVQLTRGETVRQTRQIAELTRLIAGQNGITAEQLAAIIVPQLSEELLPMLTDVVEQVLGADNEDQAEAIVDEMARRLTEGEGTPA